MSNFLITGGLGYVGGRLAKTLAAAGSVIISSRKIFGASEIREYGAIGHVSHSSILEENTFPSDIDVVVHLAALNEIDCVTNPEEAIKINIADTNKILQNAISKGAKKFIYFSTAHVYAAPLVGYFNEESATRPTHLYALTHKAAEDFVLAASDKKLIDGIVVRLSNSFGPPIMSNVNRWTLLVNDLCKQAIQKQSLTLLSNGCQFRDFVTLTDVCHAVEHLASLSSAYYGNYIFNVGSGKSKTILEMARMIQVQNKKLFGSDIPIHLPKNAQSTTEKHLDFDISKLYGTGFRITNDFEEELYRMLEFCQKAFG